MIRVVLPHHLRKLARVEGEVQLDVAAPVTLLYGTPSRNNASAKPMMPRPILRLALQICSISGRG